jgi:hypothetical protein
LAVAALVLVNLGLLLWGAYHQPPAVPAAMQPRADIRPEQLQPLPRERVAEPDTAGSEKGDAVAKADAAGCWTVGPFLSPEAAAAGGLELGRIGLAYTRRSGRDAVVEGFRVLVGPLRSPGDVQAMRRRLVELGIEDHYIIRSGPENAIALGFFSSKAGAEAYAEQLAAKGIRAYLKERALENAQVYWLDLTVTGLSDAQHSALDKVEWASPPAQLRPRSCAPE